MLEESIQRFHSVWASIRAKELDESNGDYVGMLVRKPFSHRSDKKRTFEFPGEILAMIDDNLNYSISSISQERDSV